MVKRNITTFANLTKRSEEDPFAGRDSKAALRLREAYQAFAEGRPSTEDCDLILVDLAKFSGYYNTTLPDTEPMTVKFYEGQRSVFGRIAGFINPGFDEMQALGRAVKSEMQLDGETGREID